MQSFKNGVVAIFFCLSSFIGFSQGTINKHIGFLIGDGDKSISDYKTLVQSLTNDGWEIQHITRYGQIDNKLDVLLVCGNSDLDDYDAFRIDIFLAKGGKAILALKGVDIIPSKSLSASKLKKDAILRAVRIWGVEVQNSLVLDETGYMVPYQESEKITYVKYPHWFSISPENCSFTNPVTANIKKLDIFWPSPLVLHNTTNAYEEVLVRTTDNAWLQTNEYFINPIDQDKFMSEADVTRGGYNLMIYISGVLPRAYKGPNFPIRIGDQTIISNPNTSAKSDIVVIGGGDFINELLTITESYSNTQFVVDLANWLDNCY